MAARYKYNCVNYLLSHLRGNASLFIVSLHTKVTRTKTCYNSRHYQNNKCIKKKHFTWKTSRNWDFPRNLMLGEKSVR